MEFSYNNLMHASMRIFPFWAEYHSNPEMHFEAANVPADLESEIEADALLEGLQETHRIIQENLIQAQKRHTRYAGGKQITFEVADEDFGSRRNTSRLPGHQRSLITSPLDHKW